MPFPFLKWPYSSYWFSLESCTPSGQWSIRMRGAQLVEPVWEEKSHWKSPSFVSTIEALVSSCYSELYLPDRTCFLSRFESAVAGGNDCSVVVEGKSGLLTWDVLTPSSVVKLTLVDSDTNLNIGISHFGVSRLE